MDKVKFIGDAQSQPHDTPTEHAVLATLMRYNEKFSEYGDLLHEGLFYYDAERAVFKAVEGVISEGGLTDVNSLADYAQRKGLGVAREDFLGIFQLASTATLGQDIARLRRMERQRTCWMLLQQGAQRVLDPTCDIDEEVGGVLSALSEAGGDADDGISDFAAAVDDLGEIVRDNMSGKRAFLKTGFRIFDDYFLLRPTTLTVIAAFTSVGKTALAMNIAANVAGQGVPVAYYSLEMGRAELASRVISRLSGVPSSVLMNKPLAAFQEGAFRRAAEEYRALPIYIDERSTATFDRTLRSMRTMARSRKVRLVVIDYLQIYVQNTENVEAGLAAMARAAKNAAKELGIAVILLSQLNRSGAHPSIRMLRGSGQIEESADNIVLIDRPAAYPGNAVTKYEGEYSNEAVEGTAKLMLVKGRGVGTGCSLVGFDGQFTRFYEMGDGEEAPF